MSTNRVNIEPMSAGIRSIPKRLRPWHPPIFPDGDPTKEDIELARALFEELDEESRNWYATPERPLFGGPL